MAMFDTDLPGFAESLQKRGLEARAETYGTQLGLWVDEYFYPLWELNLEESRDALSRLAFDEIRRKRAPNWTVTPPIRLGEQ